MGNCMCSNAWTCMSINRSNCSKTARIGNITPTTIKKYHQTFKYCCQPASSTYHRYQHRSFVIG